MPREKIVIDAYNNFLQAKRVLYLVQGEVFSQTYDEATPEEKLAAENFKTENDVRRWLAKNLPIDVMTAKQLQEHARLAGIVGYKKLCVGSLREKLHELRRNQRRLDAGGNPAKPLETVSGTSQVANETDGSGCGTTEDSPAFA